jgi:hypothetical protein
MAWTAITRRQYRRDMLRYASELRDDEWPLIKPFLPGPAGSAKPGSREVIHRSKRRLFGLEGMTPLAAIVAPPKRPEPGRARGRPRLIEEEDEDMAPVLPPLPPVRSVRLSPGYLTTIILSPP